MKPHLKNVIESLDFVIGGAKKLQVKQEFDFDVVLAALLKAILHHRCFDGNFVACKIIKNENLEKILRTTISK